MKSSPADQQAAILNSGEKVDLLLGRGVKPPQESKKFELKPEVELLYDKPLSKGVSPSLSPNSSLSAQPKKLENQKSETATCADDNLASSHPEADDVMSPEQSEDAYKKYRQRVNQNLAGRRPTIHTPAHIHRRLSMLAAPEDIERLKRIYNNEQFELLRIAWDFFDRDNDGYISKVEFFNFMAHDIVTQRIGLLPDHLIEPIFETINNDGSGMIDLFQFLNIIKEDDDGDLLISIDIKHY